MSLYLHRSISTRLTAVFILVVTVTCLLAVLQLSPDPSDANLRAMATQELVLRRLLAPTDLSADSSPTRSDGAVCVQLRRQGILRANESVAWITAVADDDYLRPALVLATTIELFSCIKERVVLMGAGVSPSGEQMLRQMGYRTVRPPNHYECPNIDQQRWRASFCASAHSA
jgi:hypothetical protein